MDNLTAEERKRLWEGLRLQPAWRWLMEMAEAQMEGRRTAVMEPMSPGQEYMREFLKGEVAGIQTFAILVDTAIEALEIEIAQVAEEIQNAR